MNGPGRSRAVNNNIALVPACLIPSRERWLALANRLPRGSVLVCLPAVDEARAGPWVGLVRSIRALGYQVMVLPIERIDACGAGAFNKQAERGACSRREPGRRSPRR